MKNHYTKRQAIKEVGLALILTFIPIGMYAKVFLGNMLIGNLLMLLGFLLVFPYKNIFYHKRIVKWSSNIKWFISFFVLSFLYLFIYSSTDVSFEKEMLYLGVSLGTCIALVNTNYECDFKIEHVILYTLIISFFCVICGLFFCISGMRDNFEYYVQDKLIYDDLTAGSISVINICCCSYFLCGYNRRTILNCLSFAFIVIDFYHIVLTGKRTPLIVGMLCVLYLFYVRIRNKHKIGIKYSYIFLVVLIIIFVFTNEVLYQTIISLVDSTIKGFNDLIYGASFDATNSTSIRYNARQDSLDDLSTYSTMEYIFGRGYMYMWMDIPILQAYMDMGILGFMLFIINVVIIPLKCIIKYAANNRKIMWATLICSYGMLGSLTTGTPYDHGKWLYIAVLLFILNGEKRKLFER